MSEEPAELTGSRSIRPGLIAAFLAALTYAGTLGHGFVYDDGYILRSPLLGDPWNLGELFTNGFFRTYEHYSGLYRPLAQWTFLVNASLARALTGSLAEPMTFHAVNVLLHALASFLLYRWLARLPISNWIAGATAVLWAVHPVHAEVVASIWNRQESLSAVFGFSFLLAHRARRPVLAAFLYLAALGSKESAIAFLPLALFVDFLFPVEGRRFNVRACVLPCLALASWFALRSVALARENMRLLFVENPLAEEAIVPRILTASKVQVLYLRDQILPLWLATDHSFAQIPIVRTVLDPFVLAFTAILVSAVVVAYLWRAKRPEIALSVLGYAVFFSTSSNFLFPIGTIMGDRLAYLPSVFSCLLAAVVLTLVRSRRLANGIVIVVVGGLMWTAVAQARVWRDPLTLFGDQVVKSPFSAKAHSSLGHALREHGRFREAVAEFAKSIEIYPERPEPYLGLAETYELLAEEPEIRLSAWTDALRFGPTIEGSVRLPVLAFADLGRWKDIARVRAEVAASEPDHPFLRHLDRILDAARALMGTPADPETWLRARAHFTAGRWADAAEEYRRALHRGVVPGSEMRDAILRLARCHDELGSKSRADWFRRVAAEDSLFGGPGH